MSYGCNNRRPFVDRYPAKSPDQTSLTQTVWIKNANSRDCQYCKTDLGKVDPGCDGCKWRTNGKG